jgi:hypothetical protein
MAEGAIGAGAAAIDLRILMENADLVDAISADFNAISLDDFRASEDTRCLARIRCDSALDQGQQLRSGGREGQGL